MKPINVLAITNVYPTEKNPGETPCIKDQLDALRDYDINIDLMIIDRSKKINYLLALLKVFLLSLQNKPYHLIHAFYGHCGLAARCQLKYPVVVTFRGSDILEKRDGFIGKWVAKRISGVIVMSEEMKKKSGRPDAIIIPFGVNHHLFQPMPKDEVQQELNLDAQKKYILFPWDPTRSEKRFDIIEASLGLVQKEIPEIELLPIFDKSHDLIAKYMNACDVMVLASDYEGSPMAIREAVSCCLPIVSVGVGDVRQIIDGIEGSYIVDRTPEAFSEKIIQVIKQGIRASEAQSSHFTADYSATQVLEVYNSVLYGTR